jgi:hypothetical protein
MTIRKSLTIHSDNESLIVRDNDSGEVVGSVPSASTISEKTNSWDIAHEVYFLLPGPVESVEHDRGEVIVCCAVQS